MKKFLVLFLFTFFCFGAGSVIVPAGLPSKQTVVKDPVDPIRFFSTLSLKEVQQLAGRKLTLKEKIAVKFFQWKVKKGFNPMKKAEQSSKGKTAMILGIIGIASLLIPIPYIGALASLICLILALTMGYKAKKENPDDRHANTAIILGWIGVGLFVLALLLVLAFLSTWSWGWG